MAEKLCDNCEHLKCEVLSQSFTRCTCDKSLVKKFIQCLIDPSAKIVRPDWCPLDEKNKVEFDTLTDYAKLEYVNKLIEKKYGDKVFGVKWNEVQFSKVYHMPKFFGFDRCDIVLESKTDTTLTFRVVSNKPTTYSSGVYNTLYIHKDSLRARFIYEPKLKKAVLKTTH